MDGVIEWFERTGNSVNKAIDPALEAGAEPVLAEIKATTAYKDKSGLLRKSQKIGKAKTVKGRRVIRIGDVDGKAPHAHLLEYGTSKMSAHPFMRPAFEKTKMKHTDGSV